VVNFVAQGSIEEGMLSVLAFKKSLFAGVLDGGESSVSMHGTRLAKFMESVEEATRATAETPVENEAEEVPEIAAAPAPEAPAEIVPAVEAAATTDSTPVSSPVSTPVTSNPWAPLLEVGLQFLGSLASAGQPGQAPSPFVETDPNSGRAYLKLPVPEPAALQRLADTLRDLLIAPRP